METLKLIVLELIYSLIEPYTLPMILIVVGFSVFMTALALILMVTNRNRANKMVVDVDEVVNFNNNSDNFKSGKVIEDKGNTIRIEIELPRHLVSKIKKKKVK